MFETRQQSLAASLAQGIGGIVRLPAAIRASLFPASEDDARQIDAQLDLVSESIRLFNFAFPLVGIILLAIEIRHANPLLVFGSWFAIVATSIANEFVLRRKPAQQENTIERVGNRARTVTAMAFVQSATWVSLILWAWRPSEVPSNMFGVLVVSCTLAGVSMRFAPHVASVAASLGLLAVIMFTMESMRGVTGFMAMFQLALVYTTLMIFQAFATHQRFSRTWRLEADRERLIENLRTAKTESDLAREQAVAASRAKSAFLSNMSHELRTPLNAIIGFSDIISSKTFGNAVDRYSEYGGLVNQSGHNLLSLIDSILELAKIESGNKKLQQEPIDLAGLVLDEVYRAGEKAAKIPLTVVHNLPHQLPLLLADVRAVRQILANLLSNAVKFTQPGGKVEVSAKLNAGNEIELCVSDDGMGIEPEVRPFLFDRFGRGSPDVTTAQRGSGLGLPIVKGLVELHGGHVRLVSEIGEGTSITVVFPARNTVASVDRRVA